MLELITPKLVQRPENLALECTLVDWKTHICVIVLNHVDRWHAIPWVYSGVMLRLRDPILGVKSKTLLPSFPALFRFPHAPYTCWSGAKYATQLQNC